MTSPGPRLASDAAIRSYVEKVRKEQRQADRLTWLSWSLLVSWVCGCISGGWL